MTAARRLRRVVAVEERTRGGGAALAGSGVVWCPWRLRIFDDGVAGAHHFAHEGEQIGQVFAGHRLFDLLDELGLADDTVVFFTSDNGGLATSEGSPTCNAPLAEGKGWMYEGGTREPLLVRWPGHIAAGDTCDSPVTSPDFYPTLLDLAGLDPLPAQHCDGENIAPLLRGEALDRGPIFWHYPHYGNQGGTPGSSVRKGDYKLIEFFEDGRLELYNLRDDIGEDRDLAADDPQTRDRLHAQLKAWREKVEAKIPQPNPDGSPA